jgi:multisubunit Na+/H+ antiporter MnhE subunit
MVKTIGYILLIVSCLAFLMILVIPWLGFSKIQMAGITTGLIIAGEVLFYLSLFILGKSFYEKIKSRLRFRKSKKTGPGIDDSLS